MEAFLKIAKGKKNYYCILGEGLFNQTGSDLMSITSIMPLFLAAYGASLGLIGMLTTLQGVTQAIVPFLSGGFVARAKSKRRISIVGNGISRTMIFLIPASLLFGLPHSAVVSIFICTFVLLVSISPMTGLTWNYLLNDCLSTLDRPKLLGVIFVTSGIVSLGTSNLVKVIRDSKALPENMKYFYIFGLAGLFMATSVLWFLPLRENRCDTAANKVFCVKDYMASLALCFKNKSFNRAVSANAFSYMSMVLNAFLYIYAVNGLKLQSHLISNMIIVQTVGQIAGGVITGKVSARFGVKRMLIMSECAGLFIPLLEILCMGLKNAYPAMCVCVFLFGFVRSGMMGYNNYIIEVVERDRIIFHMVTRGLVLMPVSFLSTAAGIYIQGHSMAPLQMLQAAASCTAIFLCMRLKLVSRDSTEITV